jgi:TonB-dependent SusC/RagA subfamily outer membrane receptor
MKAPLLFYLLIFSINYGGFAQAGAYDPVDKLKSYFSTFDPERAYLQFDKPYYAAGDTIYFKAYVTQGGDHKLSGLSGVLHVDLINTKNKIDQSIKLRLDSGVCWGDFALPDSIPTGNYRIRAYTQWMLNLGELDFFDQTIPVGAIVNRNVPDSGMKQPQRVISNQPDLQFFPEGGTFVEGVNTKVAFKAIGTNGLGMDVKGVVVDKDNRQVCSFESSYLGMGYFYLNPDKDNTYKAELTFSDGTQAIVDLPKPEASGISLSVADDSAQTISITIQTNGTYYQANRNKDFLLVIYSGEKAMTYLSKQEVPVIPLDIEKKAIQTGVSTITLFSPDGEPLCERLLFVQNNDALNLKITSDKTEYGVKEKVNLMLNAKGPAGLSGNGHFSVAVVDESSLPLNENNEKNILTELLLASDLKGYVEQPSYYFNDTSEDARKNLDVLMLTQGYRNFEWRQVSSKDSFVVAFQPEKGLEITGRITNLSDKPIANGTVTLIPSKGGSLLSSKSDSKGLFHFSNLVFTDTAHIVLSAVNSKGDNSTRITYLNASRHPPTVRELPYALPVVEDTGMLSYLRAATKWHDDYNNDYSPGKGKLLAPVTVKAVKEDDQYRTQSLAGAGFADQVMHADEIERIEGNLSTSLNGRLRGVMFYGGIPYLTTALQNGGISKAGPMLVVLDGTEIMPNSLTFTVDDITAAQVETVEVLKYASASIYGMRGANGVLVITTKNGSEANKDIASIGVLPVAAIGFYKARTFYSPKYDTVDVNTTKPELRSTIYWNPEVKTDEDGNATFEYYNANTAGIYKVIIEGIDNNGNIGRVVYRYKVE